MPFFRSHLRSLALLLLLGVGGAVLLTSCEPEVEDDIHFGHKAHQPYEERMEVPALKGGASNLFIHHSTLVGKDSVMTYCLEYDTRVHHSRWVAFRYDSKTRGTGIGRTDQWADDPCVPASHRVGSGTFHGGVRGHICASSDRQYSYEANAQTFYMTNMTPMDYDFNGSFWTAFEQYVRTKGRSAYFADTLYVVKGGTIDSGKTLGYATSSAGKSIVIPRYYYMALLRVKNNQYSALAFWMEHRDYGYHDGNGASESIIPQYTINIDELERLTDIDFFPNLPDAIEAKVESERITPQVLSDWGLQ